MARQPIVLVTREDVVSLLREAVADRKSVV